MMTSTALLNRFISVILDHSLRIRRGFSGGELGLDKATLNISSHEGLVVQIFELHFLALLNLRELLNGIVDITLDIVNEVI